MSSRGRPSHGEVECFSCGQMGHHVRDCPNKGGARSGGGGGGGGAFSSGPSGGTSASDLPALSLGSSPLDAQKRIKHLLILLTPDEQSLTRLSASLLDDLRTHPLESFLQSTLLHCVLCLPQKTLLWVGLLSAMRAQQSKLGRRDEAGRFLRGMLDQLATQLQTCAREGQWEEVRLLVRFAVGLSVGGLVAPQAAWDLVARLQALVDEAQERSKRDYLLFALATLVPYLAEWASDERFAAMRAFLAERLAARDVPSSLRTESEPAVAPSEQHSRRTSEYLAQPFAFDVLQCWGDSLAQLSSTDQFLNDASEVSLSRSSYRAFSNALESVGAAPVEWHAAEYLAMPSGRAPRLAPLLRLFPRPSPSSSAPSASASSSSSSPAAPFPLNDLVLHDSISSLLSAFEALHKECTKQLLSLPLPLSEQARLNGQFLLVETLLANLLTLPSSNVREVYYGTLFLDLFKAQPNLLPPLLGSAVNFLFHHLSSLSLELVERLGSWLAFHLSNFGFVWPWLSWRYVLDESEVESPRRFVAQVLDECVRLSYWERIQQAVPEEFLALMPHQPLPAFRFSPKNIENAGGDLNLQQYFQFSLELLQIIAAKAPPQAIVQWLDQTVAPVLGSEARLRLFTPCLLESGNKSYSHLVALLDRYKSVFHTLCTTTLRRAPPGAETPTGDSALLPQFDCERLVMHSLSEYWQHSTQHLIVITGHFFAHGVLSIHCLLGWVFFGSARAPGPAYNCNLWKPLLFAALRKALDKLASDAAELRNKPRGLSLTSESREADERAAAALALDARDLLSNVVNNFHKLALEVTQRKISSTAGRAEREREKQKHDQRVLLERFKQFLRTFHADLAPHAAHMLDVVPRNSPLSPILAEIPALL